MTTEESLKRKIDTCQDLQSVVKTMKALAAVSIRQYEKAVEALADYNRTVEMGLQILLRNRQEKRSDRSPEKENLGIIIFGSDQGMCGQFNDQIVSYFLENLANISSEKIKILGVGMRIIAPLENAQVKIHEVLNVPSSVTAITPIIQTILLKLDQWQKKSPIHRLLLFYNQPLGASSYHSISKQILPLDQQWLKSLQITQWPTNMIPQFTMESNRLFAALIQQYLFVSLYRACAESLSAECNSRLASMQIAEKNIAERLDELNSEYQQQRQTAITNELLDIVSGFEALKKADSS
jgi:F-type H+-transporting ATPase subunit gamma